MLFVLLKDWGVTNLILALFLYRQYEHKMITKIMMINATIIEPRAEDTWIMRTLPSSSLWVGGEEGVANWEKDEGVDRKEGEMGRDKIKNEDEVLEKGKGESYKACSYK